MRFKNMNNFRTYNGWRAAGRVVMAGQRGIRRNEYGDFLFAFDQTCEKNPGKLERITVYRDSTGRFVRKEEYYRS